MTETIYGFCKGCHKAFIYTQTHVGGVRKFCDGCRIKNKRKSGRYSCSKRPPDDAPVNKERVNGCRVMDEELR